jgi:hypothetical protein
LIYFIQSSTGGAIKIGRTRYLRRRLRTMQTSQAEPLNVLGVCDESVFPEAALHDKFEPHRIGGEWFAGHPDILDFIRQNCRTATEEETAGRQFGGEFRKVYQSRLVAALKAEPRSSYELAKRIGVSERVVENWRLGICAPQGWALLMAAREIPTLLEAVQWLLQHGPNHPEANGPA